MLTIEILLMREYLKSEYENSVPKYFQLFSSKFNFASQSLQFEPIFKFKFQIQ